MICLKCIRLSNGFSEKDFRCFHLQIFHNPEVQMRVNLWLDILYYNLSAV